MTVELTIPEGSRWRRKQGRGDGVQGQVVQVARVTPTGKVAFKTREGKTLDMPKGMFLGLYMPQGNGNQRCEKCGAICDGKYCRDCLPQVMAFRNAARKRKQEEAVTLTTTSPRVIEQKHQPTPPPQAAAPAAHHTSVGWRITGLMWMERTIEVQADNVIDALALVEAQAPGLDVHDVRRLDK